MPAYLVRAAAVLGLLALVACEDNPDQFFKVAPKGAGQLWNDGATKPYSDAARNSFNDNFNGVSKDALCDAPKKHDTWSNMVMQPILPSSKIGITAGGINISGDNWKGLVFKDAQTKLCQANPLGVDEQELTAAWGDSNQVQVSYKINNSTIDFLQLNQGYRGTLDFASRPHALGDDTKPNPFGNHKYSIGVGVPLLKDGQAMTLDWGNNGANFAHTATELYDALMYTFAPELKSTQADCSAEQSCLAHPVGGGLAAFGARPLGIYFQVPSITQQPQASTPSIIYAYPVKLLPFSGASMMLKLDEEGPIGTSLQLGDKQDHSCTQKLGMTYGAFLDNCVNVMSDKTINDGTMTKLFGGYAHDKESYNFTVQGVDTDFASTKVGTDRIVGDSWVPDPQDTVLNFNIDIRATGKLMNEYSEDGNTFTFGATGAIYREFARRVQDDIHAQMKSWKGAPTDHSWDTVYELGDSTCAMAPGDTTWTPKPGCTGMEQFVTPAEHTTASVSPNVRKVSLGGQLGKEMGFLSALKPGDPIAIFCSDLPPHDGADTGASCQQDSECWSNKCDANACTDPTDTYFQHCGDDDAIGVRGAFFETIYERVRSVLGHGKDVNLPPALRDPKYYFTHFGYAIVKYLMAAGLSPRPTNLNEPQYGPNGTACGGRTCEPNPDHLQFDQVGQGSDSMKLEYIDRRWADHGKDPISYEYQILIISSNQQESRFRQHLDRDERGVLQTMAADRGKPLLDESNNLRITNLIGSQVLGSGRWKDVSATKDAYFCATHVDSECTAKPANAQNHPPMVGTMMELDDKGQPLLTDYKGAFTGTPFSLATNNIKLVEYRANDEAAQVELPSWKDPYDAKAGLLSTPATRILPDWRPLAPGAGFPIPVNGQRDRFVPAAAIDLSGQNLSMNLDYAEQDDHTFKILASEAQTFEGEIFLCEDPITHELLHVRQYDSIAEVQDWIYHHPGVQEACDLTLREAPGGSSDPVQILAKKAGITATVGQGSGVGRIVDVIFYDPTL